MHNFMQKIRFEEIKDDPAVGAPAVVVAVETPKEEKSVDDFGYEITPEEKGAAPEEGKPAPKKTDEPKTPEKVKDPATGYAGDPPKVEEPEKKEPEVKVEPDELDPIVADLPKEEAAKIKKFAKDHGATKEVIKAFADLRKEEIKAYAAQEIEAEKEYEREIVRQRASWHKELKDDSTFGGDKFDLNVSRVEKVMAEFMPQTKKRLTETKGMMPPYLMRDLARLAEKLYSSEKLVQGDPKAPDAKTETDDALDFYI